MSTNIKATMKEMKYFMMALVTGCYPDGSICTVGLPPRLKLSESLLWFSHEVGFDAFHAATGSCPVDARSDGFIQFTAKLMLLLHGDEYRNIKLDGTEDIEYGGGMIQVTKFDSNPERILMTIKFAIIGTVNFEITR